MSVRRTDLSWITVSDIEKAEKFFKELLGLELKEKNTEFKWLEFCGPEGGAKLGVGEGSDGTVKPGSNAIMTFLVDNLEQTKKQFEEKGVLFIGDIIEVPHHIKMVYFQDPDGNLFQIAERLDQRT